MQQFLDPQIVLAIVAILTVIVPSVLASLYYAKQLRQDPQAMPRSEVTWHVNQLSERVANLETEHKDLTEAVTDLRVAIARLTTVLEGRFPGPFRAEE